MSAKHFKIWIFQQEPGGTGAEILNGIKYVRPGGGYVPQFMMFEKIDVNGDKEHPLYTYLKVQVIILLLYDLKKKPYTPSNVHVVLILVFAILTASYNKHQRCHCRFSVPM